MIPSAALTRALHMLLCTGNVPGARQEGGQLGAQRSPSAFEHCHREGVSATHKER